MTHPKVPAPSATRQRRFALSLDPSLVSEIEAGRTERQLAHPLTVADFVAALDQTIQAHRAPACFEAGHDLNEVKALIEGHFAITHPQLAALCSVAGVVAAEGGVE